MYLTGMFENKRQTFEHNLQRPIFVYSIKYSWCQFVFVFSNILLKITYFNNTGFMKLHAWSCLIWCYIYEYLVWSCLVCLVYIPESRSPKNVIKLKLKCAFCQLKFVISFQKGSCNCHKPRFASALD